VTQLPPDFGQRYPAPTNGPHPPVPPATGTGAAPGYPATAIGQRPRGRTPGPVIDDRGRESYPDPQRSWKRSGSLFGGWVATLIAVLALGTFWQFIGTPGDTDVRDEDPKTAYETAHWYMTSVFENRDFPEAEENQCDSYPGPSPKELVDDLSPWENSDGSLPDASIGAFNPDDTKSDTFKVVITVELLNNPQPLPYLVTVDDSTEPPCVSAVVPNE
jgi:hypothetical protein